MTNPKVSVLMSVYNGERYLREAIDSILNQTFQDFEFIIINDSSMDRTNEIIKSYNDNRISLVENDKNIGLTKSLNKGIDLCRGEYIARMDADDFSLPFRFEKQVLFMDNHHRIGVIGSRASEINHEGKIIIPETAHDTVDSRMKLQLMFGTCFLHPSVMIRREVIEETGLRYDERFSTSQDYLLWWRLSFFTDFANIPECLLHYRKHSKRLSHYASTDQSLGATAVRRLVVEAVLSRCITEKEFEFHEMLMTNPRCISTDQLQRAQRWLIDLCLRNDESKFFDGDLFNSEISGLWSELCQNSSHLGMTLFLRYICSPLVARETTQLPIHLKLLIKCMRKYRVGTSINNRSWVSVIAF